jgi:hypothetical protein
MRPMNLRGWLPLLLIIVTNPAGADQTKTLAGRWSASTLRTSWNIEVWGDACGPRPGGESVPGGIVTITLRGNEIGIDGLGRSYSTGTCWETVPGQRITSHSISPRSWHTTCQSAAGDPRRVTITTSVNATDDRIDFAEMGQFEFVIEGQTCRTTMKRSRTYSLVEREGETRPVPAQPPTPAATEPLAPVRTPPVSEQKIEERLALNCSNPGPPARLEVRPTRKLLRAGDEYSFRVRVLDRAGCVIERPLVWKLVNSKTLLEVTPAGVIHVSKDATEGTATLAASVQDRSVQVMVDVVSESRYQELLLAGNFDDRGETRDSAVVTIASSNVGTKAAVLEEKARSRRLIFVMVIGMVALGLAVAALWMALGRRRHRHGEATAVDDDESSTTSPTSETWVCPTCHEEYPAETRFCAIDGNRLVPLPGATGLLEGGEGGVCPVCGQGFDPGVTVCPTHDEELVPPMALAARQAAPSPTPRRICPICGTVYGAEHQFCGNDGAALVPIN